MDSEEVTQKIAKPLLAFIFEAIPTVIKLCQKIYAVYKRLPIVYVQLIIGTVLCFFGGVYPMVFAALQAAEHGGLRTVRKNLKVLSEEVLIIIEENRKDDKKDDDGDGISDTDQIKAKDLLKRKVKLVITKMDPQKVNDAILSIYKVWMSVLAVLTIQFARTIALALTIKDFSKNVADRFLLPAVKVATPKEYQRWCPVMVDWLCTSIGISIAWKIQTIISAFTSALAGGLIMARALMLIVGKGKKDHEDTSADEIASYVFAGLGFYFQYMLKFDVPFPLNLFLWPMELAEYYIRWAVTDAAGG